jgi:hypothetical protein
MKALLAMLILTLLSSLTPSAVSADTSDLKSLILMPGPLTQAHAEEEKNCNACHGKFNKSAQDALCLDCHKPVAKDIKGHTGYHGQAPSVANASCKSCHKDHEGRDFNIVPLNKDTFNHQYTDFALEGKHLTLNCGSCHQQNTLFREAPKQCYSCHKEQDPHRESLGKDCGDCHQAQSWQKRKKFDHSTTAFPLLGQHQQLTCSSCHAGEQYTFDDNSCVSCHRIKDVHLGNYGQSCDRCHSEKDWKSLKFDHSAETDFPLKGAHQQQPCQACHFNGLVDNAPTSDCIGCHRSNDIHAGRYGEKCGSCHNSNQWRQSRFNHSSETTWPLTGEHQQLSCLQCHRGSLEDKLSTDCQSCHAGDNVHHSTELIACATCHQTENWNHTPGFDHELTALPLEGMHAISACQSCHTDLEFHQAKSECFACHQEEDVHKKSMGQQCAQCHSPNGWAFWHFDHDLSTEFQLTGAHKNLSCDSCHSGTRPQGVAGTCAGCHAAEDRHRGNFGVNCGRCHTSDSFGDVEWKR